MISRVTTFYQIHISSKKKKKNHKAYKEAEKNGLFKEKQNQTNETVETVSVKDLVEDQTLNLLS